MVLSFIKEKGNLMKRQEVIIFTTILIVSVTLISSIFIYNKNLKHKKEIVKLLQAQDISKKNTQQQYSLINEFKKYESNDENSKDFITELSNINDNNYSIDIENKQQYAYIEEDGSISVNSEDVMLLAKLINSEAGDEPFEGKIAVANVVLYRSKENKESIKDVIYAPSQFDGVQTKLFSDNPSNESFIAAREALNGKKVLDKAYYFANLKLCNPSWATEERFLCRIGDHWFFKQ